MDSTGLFIAEFAMAWQPATRGLPRQVRRGQRPALTALFEYVFARTAIALRTRSSGIISLMSACAISEVRPLDPELFETYRTKAADSIAKHGGRYLVRGGAIQAAGGTWPNDFAMIIVEFGSMSELRDWYD